MLTDFVRDHAFTIAWFGLMTMVWLGWAQEDPPERLRLPLGVGSGLGLVLTGLCVYPVVTHWRTDSALTGQYAWFGVLVGLEVLAAAIGCVVLWRRGASRWMAWWVALVVAVHFLGLAVMLRDPAVAALGVLQAVALFVLVPRLRAGQATSSRLVGPVMGLSLLLFAAASAVVFVVRHGAPWA